MIRTDNATITAEPAYGPTEVAIFTADKVKADDLFTEARAALGYRGMSTRLAGTPEVFRHKLLASSGAVVRVYPVDREV